MTNTERRLLEPLPHVHDKRVFSRAGYGTRVTTWVVGAVVALLALGYMLASYTQRRKVLVAGTVEQVDLLGSVLSYSGNDLLAQGRLPDLDSLLRVALAAEDVFAAVVLGRSGDVLAGGAADLPCLLRELSLVPDGGAHGRSECGGGVEWNARPLHAGEGWLLVGLREAILDESDRNALRRQLVLLAALLTTVVGAITIVTRLERRIGVTERFAMIGRLSGGMAHEMGSPLSVIAMRANAIAQRTAADTAEHVHAAAIVQEVTRMTAFINGLLHLSRRRGLNQERVDMWDVVENAVAELGESTGDDGIELVKTMPARPLYVMGDETMLTHALRNVVRNAQQALHDAPHPRRVDLTVSEEPRAVAVFVDDNGPGIPPDRIGRVFEPFESSRSARGGMGLGLPITRGIVLEHGGEIEIENRAGGGARVSIRLPRVTVRDP